MLPPVGSVLVGLMVGEMLLDLLSECLEFAVEHEYQVSDEVKMLMEFVVCYLLDLGLQVSEKLAGSGFTFKEGECSLLQVGHGGVVCCLQVVGVWYG